MDNSGTTSKAIPSAREEQVKEPETINYFSFDINCDHASEFKTNYTMIFKTSSVYSDTEGKGHSFPSSITGGMAGDGHNNVVTSAPEQTQKAMEITNKMAGKKNEKAVNSLGKDFKSLNQKPMFGLFTGSRVRLQKTKGKNEEPDEIEDNGLLCMVKQKGNVLIRNILTKDYESLYTEQS